MEGGNKKERKIKFGSILGEKKKKKEAKLRTILEIQNQGFGLFEKFSTLVEEQKEKK